MVRVEGFRLYLDVAEGDDLRLIDAPPLTAELYERNLPAALALEVEQHWAERFARVFATRPAAGHAPRWYSGDEWDSPHVSRFSSSFGSAFSSAISRSGLDRARIELRQRWRRLVGRRRWGRRWRRLVKAPQITLGSVIESTRPCTP